MATPPRNTTIKGQPHYLAYITPEEGQVLKDRGGAGLPGPMGIPAYFDVGEGVGGYGSGQAGDATAGTGDPDKNRTDGGTYADDQQDLSDPQQYANAQRVFNMSRGITESNPFGANNFFTKYLGINPANLKFDIPTLKGTVFRNGIIKKGGVMQGIPAAQYYDLMGGTPAQQIANNQFSKFINPQNKPGMPGFNPNFDPADEGQLRAGVQEEGYATTYGPVMEQARQQSTGEMIARGLASFTPLGPLVSMMGTKEYGLPGQPGFESFKPNNPRQSGGILSAMLGGLNPTQAKDALVGAFAPVAPAPTPTSIGTAPADLKGFENRFSQHPLTGETTVSTPVDNTLQPGFSRTTTETLPDGRTITVDKETGAVFGTNLFGGPQSSLQNIAAGEQLAGLFGENPKAAGFRDLGGMIKSVVGGENLPDNQNMYGPGMPDQTPLTPDELNDILAPSGMELGRGPSTANQYADLSGLLSQGMAIAGDIVSIPGGYMDTRTGKQYSGTYNPSASGRTYTGTQRSSSSPAPFSGARLRQGIANIFGG